MAKADLLIKNGCVIDPYNHVHAVQNIAVTKGRIADASLYEDADQVIDAKGCIVCPGLIDFHTHVAIPACEMAVDPNLVSFSVGVTTIVDAGSTGTSTYAFFRKYQEYVPVRIKAMLNVAPEGLITLRHHENADPKCWDRDKIHEIFDRYSDNVFGLKVRCDTRMLDGLGISPLLEAIKLAEEIGCPVICHTTSPPVPMEILVDYFRPGDVFTHIYHGTGYTILDSTGEVHTQMMIAQKNGVLYDASNGYKNFSIKVARKAIESGLLPDIISTDVIRRSAFADSGNVVSLPFLMSKYLAFGMSIDDIIRAVTATPAQRIGMLHDIGTLELGSIADLTILRLVDKPVIFRDLNGETYPGQKLFRPELTIKDGSIMFRQIDF